MTEHNEGTATSSDSWLRATFDLIVATGFLSIIGCLFVAFAVLMGKYELLILAYVLMGAACVRSLLPSEKRRELERTAVVGEGLKIFNGLEAHYLHHKPRSMLFYLLFPITGVWSFFFSKDRGRQELKAYWGLLQWIIVLLVVGGFGSYYRFYQHFDWKFSLTWLYMELLAVYFLCNFFAVPLSTTSLRLSLEKKRFRLFATTFVSLVILTGFTYVFAYRSNYENLVPINIMLDKRLADFKAQVQGAKKPTPLHEALLKSDEDRPYFERILRATRAFLQQQAPRIQQFNQQYALSQEQHTRKAFYTQLNELYQQRLSPIATMDEHKHFFLTVTQTPKSFWALMCIPFRESAFYFFRYKRGKLKLFKSWRALSSGQKKRLLQSWDRSAFVFSNDKRMAQVVVEFMRDKFQRASENLDKLVPRKSAPAQKNQAADPPSQLRVPKDARELARQPKAGAPAPGASTTPRRYRRQRKPRPRRRTAARRTRRPSRALPSPPTAPMPTPSLRRFPPPPLSRRARPRPRIQWGKKKKSSNRLGYGSRRRIRSAGGAAERGSKATLRRRIRRIEQLFRSLNRYLAREFGLRSTHQHMTEGARLLAIWPKPWKLPVTPDFQALLKDAVRHQLPKYRRALRATLPSQPSQPPIRWGQPAVPSKITRLQARMAKLKRSYKRTRSMYTWARMKRLKQELLRLQAKSQSPTLKRPTPTPPRSHPQLASYAADALLLQQRIATAFRTLRQRWLQLKPKRRTFSVHSAALVSFDYPRALSAMLLFDHFGATPELVQTWWTKFYEAFLTFIILLFQLTMPFHILLILFCHLRVAVQVVQEGALPDAVVHPPSKPASDTVESPISEDLVAHHKPNDPQDPLPTDPTPSSST